MSLVAPAQQPHRRHGKRSLEGEGGDENFSFGHSPSTKARRVLSAARCGLAHTTGPVPAYVVGPTAVAALRSLFPAMNEQIISEVLSDCGSDIDAAIKRLGQLQLRVEGKPAAPLEESCSAAANAAASPLPGSPANGAATINSAAAQLPTAEVEPGAAAAAASAAAAAAAPAPDAAAAPAAQQQQQQPKTPEEWVEALVQTMSQAKDLADARGRAAQALQAFEQAVSSAAQAKAASDAGQLAALQRDNAILKRAVAIQNGRLQEVAGREAELAQLRAVAKEYHERVQALELSNYSLAQHLRAATDSRDVGPGGRNPHVF